MRDFFLHFCFIKTSFLTYLAQTSPEPPLYQFTKAKGIYLYDEQGNAYIDLISGIAVNNVGHRNKAVLKAIKRQLKAYMHQMVYGEYVIGPQVELAKVLAKYLPEHLNSFYFLNSGSEAIEGAMKLAKKATGRRKFVAFKNAYHGSTQGSLSLMSNSYYSAAFKPLLPEIYFAEFNHIESLNIIDDSTAAVFIEPIQAEGGYIPAQAEFLQHLADKCKETGTLLVFDEIQSGLGRTGKMFALEHYGINPDILCLAKGLGGGMPISCFISTKEIMHSLRDNPILGHISTFGGHPVSCAAAVATVNIVADPKLLESIERKEQLFRLLLQHSAIKNISGKGLMLAVELEDFDAVKKLIAICYENGLILDWFLYKTNAIRIAPPLIISEKEIKQVCNILLDGLNAL